jgi:hypothetical protein
MADQHDDLDSWLDERIEPLPPPPGTFDLIKRRARRRKYRRLAVTAGATAVIVAAAITVPQVVSLPEHSPATATSAANGQRSATPPPASASTSPALQSAAASADSAAPLPVPASFRPTSATFIGTHTGWVIGQAGTPGHCATRYCTSVARTDDGGKTWSGGPVPLTGPPDGAAGVSQIRFLNAADGWAFGPELYATHDGGHTWTRVATGGLRVTQVETVGDRAFGLFAACTGSGTAFAAHCASYTLYSSPASADDWTPAGPATSGLTGGAAGAASAPGQAGGSAGAASLVLTGTRGYLLAPDGMLYAGPVSGGAWVPVKAIPCPVGPPLAAGSPTGALLAAETASRLVLTCASSSAPGSQQAKRILVSADGGTAWQDAGTGPALGLATSLAASQDGAFVLATGRGIDLRPAGSTTWRAAVLDGPAPKGGFGYVGMTTDEQGVALPANPAAGTVWLTYDGGQSWQPFAVSGS